MAETIAPELQRRHGNAFTERAHLAYPAQLGRNLLFRIGAQLFVRDVVTRHFAQSILVGVVADLLKSQLAAQGFEICIVGMGQRSRQIHAGAAAEANFGVLGDQALAQGSECH